jgi:hypothetical protein
MPISSIAISSDWLTRARATFVVEAAVPLAEEEG